MAYGKYNKDGNNIFEKVRKFKDAELNLAFRTSLWSLGIRGESYPSYVAKTRTSLTTTWANEIIDVGYTYKGKSYFTSKESTPMPVDADSETTNVDEIMTECSLYNRVGTTKLKLMYSLYLTYDFYNNCVLWKNVGSSREEWQKIYGSNGVYVIIVAGGGGGGGGDNNFGRGKPGGGGGGGGASALIYIDVKNTIQSFMNKYPDDIKKWSSARLYINAGSGGRAGHSGANPTSGGDGGNTIIYFQIESTTLSDTWLTKEICGFVESGLGGKVHYWNHDEDSPGGIGGGHFKPVSEEFKHTCLSVVQGADGGIGRLNKAGDAGQNMGKVMHSFKWASKNINCSKQFFDVGYLVVQASSQPANGFGGGGGGSAFSLLYGSYPYAGEWYPHGIGQGGRGSQSADPGMLTQPGSGGIIYLILTD